MHVCNFPWSKWDVHVCMVSSDSCLRVSFPIKAASWNITWDFCQSRNQRWPNSVYSKLHNEVLLFFLPFPRLWEKTPTIPLEIWQLLAKEEFNTCIAALNYFPTGFLLKLLKYQGVSVTCCSEALARSLEDMSGAGVMCRTMTWAPADCPCWEQNRMLGWRVEGSSARGCYCLGSLCSPENKKNLNKSISREGIGRNLLFLI